MDALTSRLPSVVTNGLLPSLLTFLSKASGSGGTAHPRRLPLLLTLSAAGAALAAARLWWVAIRVPPHLRHLPRITPWQTIRTMMAGQGVLESFEEQLNVVRKDAIKRGLIRSMDETPREWLIWVFGQWAVQIANPEDFKEVLTHTEQYEKFDFDAMPGLELSKKFMGTNIAMVRTPLWKTHRRIVNPAFRRGWSTSLFGAPARNLVGQLDRLAAANQPMDVADFMQRMTLDALSVAAFRKDFQSIANPNSPMVAAYNSIMAGIMNPVFALFGPLGKFLPMSRRLDREIDVFNQYMFDLIDGKLAEIKQADHQGTGDEGEDDDKDLLELMIRAQMKEGSTFSKEDLRSNCVAFFIAGHDTTANALTFALYMLGMHPDKQEKARKEIIDIMGDVAKDTEWDEFPYPTNDQQNQMSFLTGIIKETMRIWPSIVVVPMRELMSPATLHSGLRLPTGSGVSANIYALQRATEYWGADARQFKPERWEKLHQDMGSAAAGDSAPLHPGAHGFKWTPFGGGSRFCLGSNFSIIEQRVVLSMLLLRYTWKVVGNDKALKGFPDSEPGILLHPHGIHLQLTRRN